MIPAARPSIGSGLAFATAASAFWGAMPLYFLLVFGTAVEHPLDVVEFTAVRWILSLAFCAALLTIVRGWRRFGALVRDRRSMLWLAFAGVVLVATWIVFLVATLIGEVVQTALGYFITPIITILLGVVLLRERLRPLQWLAVAVSAVAVVVLVLGLGVFPLYAILLALGFAVYGFAKNRVGTKVDAIAGFTAETLVLSPVAAVLVIVIGATAGLSLASNGPLHAILLLAAGAATAIPLILFAAGARRLPLSYLGMLQYATPLLLFVTGVIVLQEPMPLWRWIGFGIVWVALAIVAVDSAIHRARSRGPRVPAPT